MNPDKNLIQLTKEIKTAHLNNEIAFILMHDSKERKRIDYLIRLYTKFVLLTVESQNDLLRMKMSEITEDDSLILARLWLSHGGFRKLDPNEFDTLIEPFLIDT